MQLLFSRKIRGNLYGLPNDCHFERSGIPGTCAEASRRGEPPEKLLRELIRHLPSDSATKYTMTGRELAEKLYREGKLASLATKRPLTPEEQEERERVIQRLAGGKPASEMIIEDRGPY